MVHFIDTSFIITSEYSYCESNLFTTTIFIIEGILVLFTTINSITNLWYYTLMILNNLCLLYDWKKLWYLVEEVLMRFMLIVTFCRISSSALMPAIAIMIVPHLGIAVPIYWPHRWRLTGRASLRRPQWTSGWSRPAAEDGKEIPRLSADVNRWEIVILH